MTDYDVIAQADAVYLDTCILPKIDIEGADDEGRLAVILIYLSRIPIFCSFVGFGEFFNVASRKQTQGRIGFPAYLFSCRNLMMEAALGKFQRAEPPEDRAHFIRLAEKLQQRFSKLGGGDIWHIMCAIELKARYENSVLFSFDYGLVRAARSEQMNAVCGKGMNPDVL